METDYPPDNIKDGEEEHFEGMNGAYSPMQEQLPEEAAFEYEINEDAESLSDGSLDLTE